METYKASPVTKLNVGTTWVGTRGFKVLSSLAVRIKVGQDKPGARARQGREHARGAHTNTGIRYVLIISPAPGDLQSEFGDGYGARFVGLQGLPEIKSRFLAAPGDLQSAFGDGYGARFAGLQDRPGLETYRASLMEIWNQRLLGRPRPLWTLPF